MYSLVAAITTIAFSLVLGAIFLALFAYYYPDNLEIVQIAASNTKDWIMDSLTSAGSKPGINVWIRFLLADEQLVFMFFVILARIVLYTIFGIFSWIFVSPIKAR